MVVVVGEDARVARVHAWRLTVESTQQERNPGRSARRGGKI
jgi:hypothetical protein